MRQVPVHLSSQIRNCQQSTGRLLVQPPELRCMSSCTTTTIIYLDGLEDHQVRRPEKDFHCSTSVVSPPRSDLGKCRGTPPYPWCPLDHCRETRDEGATPKITLSLGTLNSLPLSNLICTFLALLLALFVQCPAPKAGGHLLSLSNPSIGANSSASIGIPLLSIPIRLNISNGRISTGSQNAVKYEFDSWSYD